MSVLSMLAAVTGFMMLLTPNVVVKDSENLHLVDLRNAACYSVDTPIPRAAVMCLQVDDTNEQQPMWALRNNTKWVLDLDSPGAWSEKIDKKTAPTLADLKSYFTRLVTDDQGSSFVAVQPDETVYMPALPTADRSQYALPTGDLRFNAEATAAMVALSSALASADKVATDRSKLYKIVKRAKACAAAVSATLLATEQTDDAYSVVLAGLAAYPPCDKYLKGVAQQAKVRVPTTWRVVVRELGDNFFVETRTAVVKLFQFAR